MKMKHNSPVLRNWAFRVSRSLIVVLGLVHNTGCLLPDVTLRDQDGSTSLPTLNDGEANPIGDSKPDARNRPATFPTVAPGDDCSSASGAATLAGRCADEACDKAPCVSQCVGGVYAKCQPLGSVHNVLPEGGLGTISVGDGVRKDAGRDASTLPTATPGDDCSGIGGLCADEACNKAPCISQCVGGVYAKCQSFDSLLGLGLPEGGISPGFIVDDGGRVIRRDGGG